MAELGISVDIAVIGGGMGGCAAALAACEAGCTVLLSESTDWLGGQMTAQGVSAFDEHARIEAQPPSLNYARLRREIRAEYVRTFGAPECMPETGLPLNPGNGWVSRLCFEPRVGLRVLERMLAPHIAAGRLIVRTNCAPVRAELRTDRIAAVFLRDAAGVEFSVEAAHFLDATDLGDLLPLTHTPWRTGAESRAETGEPSAGDADVPHEVQSFTFCFAVERRPGESHVIEKPAAYEALRAAQPFTLVIGSPLRRFRMFEPAPDAPLPFWTYRRLFDARLLDPSGHGLRDVALINWAGDDYHAASLIHASPPELARIVTEAKQLSLAFLYWLQTECPHDDDRGQGYPELMLRPDIMGTADGLSKAPYVREARRITPCFRILEQHVAAAGRSHAERFLDSVGIGWYPLDLHPAIGNPNRNMFAPTHPFQIPLGALIPRPAPGTPKNLVAACKNIGTTHISNGAYRLHPVEWAIGEAAGELAAFCVADGHSPAQVWESPALTQQLQDRLRARGVRVDWGDDG
ncbi:MAG: FAD-dependent oxidoreductase [Chloroflexi bacterium]|nr:FAD-dependent oxidoreductase [Chloroflexota bacterium]